MNTPEPVQGDGLLHPVAIAAMATLIVNDHWFKHYSPGLLSGKLSDVAGLVFFPLALEAAYELVLRARHGNSNEQPFRPSPRVSWWCVSITGLGFALVEIWPPGSFAFRYTLAALQWPVRSLFAGKVLPLVPVPHVADVGDILALPALALSLLIAQRRARASNTPQPP